jgi:hypothetical protein
MSASGRCLHQGSAGIGQSSHLVLLRFFERLGSLHLPVTDAVLPLDPPGPSPLTVGVMPHHQSVVPPDTTHARALHALTRKYARSPD